jgi:hypothetical protein
MSSPRATVDQLIDELGTDLRPVKRLHSPAIRALMWLGIVAGIGVVLAYFADMPAIAHRLQAEPDMWLAVSGSSLTAILGAIAAFELSVPDRKPVWALLPLPGLLLWIGATGLGCLRTAIIPDAPTASLVEARTCFIVIIGLSVPLSIAIVLMVRRAFSLRPNLTAVTCGIAVAAAAATLLNFAHPYDAGATDIAVHIAAIAIVIGLNRVAGGRLLTRDGFHPGQ